VVARPGSTSQTGTLTIGTDAGTYTVALRETAAAAQTVTHAANLTWSAPASETVPVDSYQVERAVSGSTEYSVVGTTTAASTAFTDTSVTAGKSYVYEVRSVDDSGDTSNPSNVVTLAIP
jgi:titin